MQRPMPISHFERAIDAKRQTMFEALLGSALQGDAVKSAKIAGQIEGLAVAVNLHREAARATDAEDHD